MNTRIPLQAEIRDIIGNTLEKRDWYCHIVNDNHVNTSNVWDHVIGKFCPRFSIECVNCWFNSTTIHESLENSYIFPFSQKDLTPSDQFPNGCLWMIFELKVNSVSNESEGLVDSSEEKDNLSTFNPSSPRPKLEQEQEEEQKQEGVCLFTPSSPKAGNADVFSFPSGDTGLPNMKASSPRVILHPEDGKADSQPALGNILHQTTPNSIPSLSLSHETGNADAHSVSSDNPHQAIRRKSNNSQITISRNLETKRKNA